MDLKGLLYTSFASAITAAEKLLEEMKHRNESDPHLNEHISVNCHDCSFNGLLISECITTSNKIFSLIPHTKHW